MKSTVQFPILPGTKLLVSIGDKIDSKTIIAESTISGRIETINLAKILHVKEGQIAKFLKKKLEARVEIGEIIAEKKSFFSSDILKSPISGKLSEIDLKKGTLTLVEESENIPSKIMFPIQGKVKAIGETCFDLEVEAILYKAHSGDGDDVSGQLFYIPTHKLGVLEVPDNVDKQIVACKEVSCEAEAKLDTLGTRGMVLAKVTYKPCIPWVQIDENELEKLFSHQSQKIWLRPKDKQIIIWE